MTPLDRVTEAIESLLRGQVPQAIWTDEASDHSDLVRLFHVTNDLVRSFSEAQEFILGLSEGNLDVDPPRRNFLVSSFKQLHANLRHLTWQTQQVARGDLSQRVDFLGDFSHAFNAMIDALREKRLIEQALQRTNEELVEAHVQIMDGLQYARTIQTAFLPHMEDIAGHLANFFVIWKPKDLIGGDMYRFHALPDGFLVAVIDCTGHGVPGAIMTMIAGAGLDQAQKNVGTHDPALILQELNGIVKRAVHQHQTESPSDDGLDIGICRYDAAEGRVVFSGARISLWYGAESKVREIRGDKQALGYKASKLSYGYTNHVIPIASPTSLYMTTDGLIHQIGGPRGIPFGRARFARFLSDHQLEPMGRQRVLLDEALDRYRCDEPQVDDITVFGFRLGED